MTPQEKAKELVEKFRPYTWSGASFIGIEEVEMMMDNPKQCALIDVEEMLFEVKSYVNYFENNAFIQYRLSFWKQVKEEIGKI